MYHARTVHIGHGREHLFNQIGGIFFRIRAFFYDTVEEFAPSDSKEKKIEEPSINELMGSSGDFLITRVTFKIYISKYISIIKL